MSSAEIKSENFPPETDAELLTRFVDQQDGKSLELLVEKHSTLMMSVCYHILRNQNDAEDAFQNTVVALAKKASSIKQPQYFSTWLYRVAQHEAFSIRRLQKREQTVNPSLEKSAVSAHNEINSAQFEELTILHEELDQLPEKVRGPLVLCYLEGMSRKEAAQELNVTDNSIKASLVSGRKQLRDRLLRRGVAMASVLAAWNVTQTQVSAAISTALVQQSINGSLAQTVSASTATTSLSTSTTTGSQGALFKGATWMAVSTGKKFSAGLIASIMILGGAGAIAVLKIMEQLEEPVQVAKQDSESPSTDLKELIANIKEKEPLYQNTDMTMHFLANVSITREFDGNEEGLESRSLDQDIHQVLRKVTQGPRYLIEFDEEINTDITELFQDGRAETKNQNKQKHQSRAFDGATVSKAGDTPVASVLQIDPNPYQVVLGSSFLGSIPFSDLLQGGEYTTKLIQENSDTPLPDDIQFFTHFLEQTELGGEPVIVVEFNSYRVKPDEKELIKKHRIHLAINKNYIPMKWEGGLEDDRPPAVDYQVLSWEEHPNGLWFPKTAEQKINAEMTRTISYRYEVNALNPEYPQEFFRVTESKKEIE